jgi:hypothetical protein
VAIALERFRRCSLRLCGLRGQAMGAAELAGTIRRRFPQAASTLEADLVACEEAVGEETVSPREALKLIQTLHEHEQSLAAAARLGSTAANSQQPHSIQHERAS